MNKFDIEDYNLKATYFAIKNGCCLLSDLQKKLNISLVSIYKYVHYLIDKDIICCETIPECRSGRRTNIHKVVDKYHTMFFEYTGKSFRCISIDIAGRVVDRFDFVIIPRLSMKDNLKVLYKRFANNRKTFKYCVDIFASCDEEIARLLPKSTKVLTKEQIILEGLSEDDKSILFKLGDKYAASLYSHILYPKAGVGEKSYRKIIDFDKEYEFSSELYDGVFLALAKHSLKRLDDFVK